MEAYGKLYLKSSKTTTDINLLSLWELQRYGFHRIHWFTRGVTMVNVMEHIGSRIRLHRLAKGWTQEQLADVIYSTGSYIGQLERGEKNFRIQTLVKIADAMEVSIFSLIGNENDGDILKETWVWESMTLILQQDESKRRKIFRVLREILEDD
jgi:transcriptional regulator with XRE-family HTH domain